MSSNYANILANKYHNTKDTSMQVQVELAFIVVEVLGSATSIIDPWDKLLVAARGLIKTRAKRSKTRFQMQFIKALEYADLSKTAGIKLKEVGIDLPKQREELFKTRILNPQFLRKHPSPTLNLIEPKKEVAIIKEEIPVSQEREDEFRRRVSDPRKFRRGD